jgi:DNA-binding NtrC family response regulator
MSGTPPPTPPPSPATPPSARPPSTILIVEDDAALRRVLARALTRQGYHVLAAASAESAYELLASERADAVLLDVQLPTMSGLALYLALIHRHPNLAGRIAIMSGDAEAEHVRAWLEHNPCTVLKKPFDLHQIVEWAHGLLDVTDRRSGNG